MAGMPDDLDDQIPDVDEGLDPGQQMLRVVWPDGQVDQFVVDSHAPTDEGGVRARIVDGTLIELGGAIGWGVKDPSQAGGQTNAGP